MSSAAAPTVSTKPASAPPTRTAPSPPPVAASSSAGSDPTGADEDATAAATTANRQPRLERQGTTELTDVHRERLQLFESSKDLQELCRDNGLTATQFAKRGHQVTQLDMFLGFWPSMQTVRHFGGLRELAITKHPTITTIEGLGGCPQLESLAIVECGLMRIEGLEDCRQLRRLNLSCNKIRVIEGLESLTELEVLWLNDNWIDELGGLAHAPKLETLWVCRNRIERIDTALSGCHRLTELNLADNRIHSFKSLLSLANLEHLAVLTLQDPHFGDNPVCRLCNYQTYVMCQLNRLTWLDTLELSTRNKQIAEATMLKKKMYYNMRIKTIKRDIQQRIRRADSVRVHTQQHLETNIAALLQHKKDLEQYVLDASGGVDNATLETIRAKLTSLESLLRAKCGVLHRMNQDFDRLRSRLQWTSDVNISRLLLELDTGGNIRLEDGKPGDAWYGSCVDLVKSRLFVSDLRPLGVGDIRIHRVTRIHNRHLRNRFHTRMEEILVVKEDKVKDNVSKKGVTVAVEEDDDDRRDPKAHIEHEAPADGAPENSLEYLFYTQPPLLEDKPSADLEQFAAAENGLRDPVEYRRLGLEGSIRLSNSVALLDTARLLTAVATKALALQRRELTTRDLARYSTLTIGEQERELRQELTKEMRDVIKLTTRGDWELPRGTLLVVKVFPGYTKTLGEGDRIPTPVDIRDYPGLHSLQVVKNPTTSILTPPHAEAAKQKFYYLFDKTLVLPEYLVEYEYVTNESAMQSMEAALLNQSDPIQSESRHLVSPTGANADSSSDLGGASRLSDEFERQYRVRRPTSPHSDDGDMSPKASVAGTMDEDVVKLLAMTPQNLPVDDANPPLLPTQRIAQTALKSLRHLNLFGCKLDTIPDLSSVKSHLQSLVLSHNRLVSISAGLNQLNALTDLDLSYNRIVRIDHLDALAQLQSLDLNHNDLHAVDDLEALGRRKQSLRRLDLRKNPLCESKRYRAHILRHLDNLDSLDQQNVGREELVAAQRLITKLSPDVLWNHYRSVGFTTRLDQPAADTKDADAMLRFERGNTVSSASIEELSLTRELVRCIEHMDKLVNLRILSFADNVIQKIDGLRLCTRLEELNLEDNEIVRLENLDAMVNLKRLNIARNRLGTIEHLDALSNLTQLSLEDNHITSLRGLSSAMKLMELYIGNNRIDILKEVQHLKSLPKLTILDLSGNEITRMQDYRLYTVYYLRRVKVLDGLSVSPQDQSDAKQKYSGKLTLEFVIEKCGGGPLERLHELDLSACRIRELGSIHGKVFVALKELSLENNQISDISGLESLPKLRVLNLNRNRIEKLLSPSYLSEKGVSNSPETVDGRGILGCLKLEQLFLAYNQISDMTALGLQCLDDLKVLHLQGNSIVFFAGLESNASLIELRLDKNKIRQLDAQSTTALRRLKILSLEDNGLKTLSYFNELQSLEYLDISNNRLLELDELDKFNPFPPIVELRMNNNPCTKKHLYRQTVVYKFSSIRSLDGREVAADERERIEILFLHERAAALAATGDRSSISAQLNLAPSAIPSGKATSSNSSGTSILTPGGQRAQLAMSEGLAGSILRKNGTNVGTTFSPNQQSLQSGNTFPKSDQPTDVSIAIAPSNTTTKSLLNNPNVGYRMYGMASNQSTMGGAPILSSATPTVTVAAAFNASLSNTGGDHFTLAGVRSDRRRMTSIHYDPSINGTIGFTNSGAGSLSSTLVSTHAVLRGPGTTPAPASIMNSLSADSSGRGAVAYPPDNGRSFSGYVVSFGNQKRFSSFQDPAAIDLATALASAQKGATSTRPR